MEEISDLIIRNGKIIDGSGGPEILSDILIKDGKIEKIGKLNPSIKAKKEIDANGFIVTPGFVDIHTHYDGQATWDNYLSPSSWHGVTTALMGNCGVGFAPVHDHDHDRLISLMEGVEDIPDVVLTEGLEWNWNSFSDYLNIIYLPGAGELTVFSAACVGACLGYLWFNAAPAEVFMGDIGSLSTGAALGTLAILLKKEFLLIIIGGVFVAEAISVILQVSYFRYTKKKYGEPKKLFLMAPIHHHFELKGWPESRVVIRFWIIGLLFALLTIATFKIR